FFRLPRAVTTWAWKMSGSSCASTWPAVTRELKSAKMYFTVPETEEPTGTVVSGLMVPVASTVAVRGPRLTGAVRYFGLPDPLRSTRPAKAIRTTAAPAKRSHLRQASGTGGAGELISGKRDYKERGRWISLPFSRSP